MAADLNEATDISNGAPENPPAAADTIPLAKTNRPPMLRAPFSAMYRTHSCNDLRKEHVGQTVTLCGWVNTNRDHHGVIFIDLRDREGVTQLVFRPEENAAVAEASHKLRGEDVVQITGRVDK